MSGSPNGAGHSQDSRAAIAETSRPCDLHHTRCGSENPRNPGWGLGEEPTSAGSFLHRKENSSHRCSPSDYSTVSWWFSITGLASNVSATFEFDHALLAELALHLDLEAFALPDRHDPVHAEPAEGSLHGLSLRVEQFGLGITSTMIRGTSSL